MPHVNKKITVMLNFGESRFEAVMLAAPLPPLYLFFFCRGQHSRFLRVGDYKLAGGASLPQFLWLD